MHFPPCFRFSPYFPKKFWIRGKFSQFHLFPTNFTIFSHQNIFRIFPYLTVSIHFPPSSLNLYFPPTFAKFPFLFRKIYVFLHILRVFRFPPYFYHDAFMHHPMHVLGTPGAGDLSSRPIRNANSGFTLRLTNPHSLGGSSVI